MKKSPQKFDANVIAAASEASRERLTNHTEQQIAYFNQEKLEERVKNLEIPIPSITINGEEADVLRVDEDRDIVFYGGDFAGLIIAALEERDEAVIEIPGMAALLAGNKLNSGFYLVDEYWMSLMTVNLPSVIAKRSGLDVFTEFKRIELEAVEGGTQWDEFYFQATVIKSLDDDACAESYKTLVFVSK